MVGVLAQTDCSLEISTNSEKSTKLSECRKCAALKQQLHQALNKLSSAQLITELFNKEHTQDSVDTTVSQQVHNDLEKYDKWKLVMPRHPKVKIGDKYTEMEKVTECTIEQRLISKNPYIVLEEDDIISNDVMINSVSETERKILTVTEWITSITQSDIVQL
jgi:murein L,D-transpeptidase YcbB/YkuD